MKIGTEKPGLGILRFSQIKATLCKMKNQFNSVAQSCPILCDPIDCRTPGLPAHHQLSEFTQTNDH